MGDISAKVDQKDDTDTEYLGKFGLGERNHRGDMINSNFMRNKKMNCLKTFFEKSKQRKQIWISPNLMIKNEIDYVLLDTRKICTNVEVLNRFGIGNDHRLIRASLAFNF